MGDFIFVSAQLPWTKSGVIGSKGNFSAQLERVYENIAQVLAVAGASMDNVVKVTNYLTDPRFYSTHAPVRTKVFTKDPPTSTLIITSGLASPEALIAVEAIAYTGRGKRVFNYTDSFLPPGLSSAISAGRLLFVTGQTSLSKGRKLQGKGDHETQLKVVFDNIQGILALAGCSTRDVIKTTNFLANPHYISTLPTISARYFPHRPCSTTVVAHTAFPETLAETEAIAALGGPPEYFSMPNANGLLGDSQVVRVGDLVFTAAFAARSQTGRLIGKGDLWLQVRSALSNMNKALTLAGVELRQVIKFNIYLASPAYVTACQEALSALLGAGSRAPAATIVAMPALANPDNLVEIDAMAVAR